MEMSKDVRPHTFVEQTRKHTCVVLRSNWYIYYVVIFL